MNKPTLLVLHGALGAKAQFTALEEALSNNFNVYTLEFEGHGNNEAEGAFSIDRFVMQTHATLRALDWTNTLVFGYSMGGYVALKLEATHPGTFSKIVTLGTKFNWTPEAAAQETRMLNPEKIAEKVPAFAVYLQSLHGEDHWKNVMGRTAEMMLEMGNRPPVDAAVLAQIQPSVICLRGEKDQMVTEAETLWAVDALPNALYLEMPEWQHPIDKIPTADLAKVVAEKLQ